MDLIQDAVLNAAIVIITALVGVLTRKVVEWMNTNGLSKKLIAKEESVKVAVNAVEQIAINEKGPEKKDMALKFLITILNENGIKMTTEEMNIMVEGILGEAKKEAKDAFLVEPKSLDAELISAEFDSRKGEDV